MPAEQCLQPAVPDFFGNFLQPTSALGRRLGIIFVFPKYSGMVSCQSC